MSRFELVWVMLSALNPISPCYVKASGYGRSNETNGFYEAIADNSALIDI